jgi:hypothetical protein
MIKYKKKSPPPTGETQSPLGDKVNSEAASRDFNPDWLA